MPCRTTTTLNGSAMGDTVNPDLLSQQLDSSTKDLLILDCRSPCEYNMSHIHGAIHVAIPSIMLRRLKKGNLSVASVISCNEGKERFDRKYKSEDIILYDESTSDVMNNSSSVITLLLNRLKADGCRVYGLQGGFTTFQQAHPYHCVTLTDPEDGTILGLRNLQLSQETDQVGEEALTPNSSSIFPVQVLPFLYLGNATNSADMECLDKNDIKYIMNVTPNVPNSFEDNVSFKYMQIAINDHWNQNLSAFFPEAIAFIDEARQKKCGVLVHCLAGISRSVTVTVAYLMHSLSLSLNDAYDFVKNCKPNISPNFNFMGQLLDYERSLKQNRKCCCPKGEDGLPLRCLCRSDNKKAYFSSPTTSSASSVVSCSTSSSSSSSGTEFDYEVPPTPS